jgi:hypothetical protein
MATPKLTPDAAQGYLRSRGLTVESQNVGYLRRIVGNLKGQEAAGVPLSLEAARGHVFTPEHPTRRRPRLPAPAVKYGNPRRTKYRKATQPIDREPRLMPPITVRAPHVHTWMGRPAPGMVLDMPGHKILISRSHERVRTFLRQLERETPEGTSDQWRVGFDVYDCETHGQTSIFRTVRGHRGPASEGMVVSHLLDEAADMGYGIEEYLIRMSIDGGSGQHILLTHICEYAIYAHRP